MAVYVDVLRPCARSKNWRYDKSCHLIADSESELIDFAVGLGLKKSWIQISRITHFDLNGSKRELAVAAGAVQIGLHTFVEKMYEAEGRAE